MQEIASKLNKVERKFISIPDVRVVDEEYCFDRRQATARRQVLALTSGSLEEPQPRTWF